MGNLDPTLVCQSCELCDSRAFETRGGLGATGIGERFLSVKSLLEPDHESLLSRERLLHSMASKETPSPNQRYPGGPSRTFRFNRSLNCSISDILEGVERVPTEHSTRS